MVQHVSFLGPILSSDKVKLCLPRCPRSASQNDAKINCTPTKYPIRQTIQDSSIRQKHVINIMQISAEQMT